MKEMYANYTFPLMTEESNLVTGTNLATLNAPAGSLTFEDAINLFKKWGFQVEPGPQPDQVTLILEGPDFRTYAVQDAEMLTQMAAIALQTRLLNGMLLCLQRWQGQVLN